MTTRQIHVDVIRRFGDLQASDTQIRPRQQPAPLALPALPPLPAGEDLSAVPERLHSFFQVAEHRKRYFLEKMLLDA